MKNERLSSVFVGLESLVERFAMETMARKEGRKQAAVEEENVPAAYKRERRWGDPQGVL